MKIFISHHIKKDKKLASTLSNGCKRRGIAGYIATKQKEYELLIVDKIKNEIETSDYLVAIITKNSLKSASVHEEIGYAIGVGIPVILMVEDIVQEEGVLIHGKEPEVFKRSTFESHSEKIIKHIVKKGKPKKQKKNVKGPTIKERDQYQQYNPAQKVTKLRQDLVASFKEHKFSIRIKKIKVRIHKSYWTPEQPVTIVIAEKRKTRQRFFCLCYNEVKDEEAIRKIDVITTRIFNDLSLNGSWNNLCLIISHGNVVKTRISNYFNKIFRTIRNTKQNTLITFDPSIIYYGLGQGKMGFTLKNWNFPSSMPKFFAHSIKTKNDLTGRIGFIDDFLEVHKTIFKNIPKLKLNQNKFQIIPEKKAKEKREKKAKEREKKRAKNLARQSRSRRYLGSYRDGNPAYIGTPKE